MKTALYRFMTILFLGLVALTCPVVLLAQPSVSIGTGPAMTPIYPEFTVAQLPADPPTGTVVIVTDAATPGDCATGGGSALAHCRWDGAAWGSIGVASGGETTFSAIGIGVDPPQTLLHVVQNDQSRSPQISSVIAVEGSTSSFLEFILPNSTSGGIRWTDPEAVASGLFAYNHATNAFSWRTAGVSDRMVLDTDGQLGIGVVNALARIHGVSDDASEIVARFDTAVSATADILRLTNNGTSRFNFEPTGRFRQTNTAGLDWRFDLNGTAGVGDFEINPNSTGTFDFTLFGPSTGVVNLVVSDGTLSVGDLTAVGADPLCWDGVNDSLIGDCTSLRQYKENIQPLDLGLETVLAMQPRAFTWTAEMGGKEDLGFVAEEVEAVSPLIASYANYGVDEPTGEQLVGVKYAHYTAVLTKAIQEQQALIATLQQQVAALEALHSE